ncbi:MAG TPA: hypothetical protein VG890_01820 [Puia sp.]|nr:hypothetical protein [Puia sp.]
MAAASGFTGWISAVGGFAGDIDEVKLGNNRYKTNNDKLYMCIIGRIVDKIRFMMYYFNEYCL